MPVPGPVAEGLMVWIEDEGEMEEDNEVHHPKVPVPGPVAEALIVEPDD